MGTFKEKIQKFLLWKYRKILFILLSDIGFAIAAFAISRSISFYASQPANFSRYAENEIWIAAVFVAFTVLMLALFDLYNAFWRYAGRIEFFKIALAYLASAGILFVFKVIMENVFTDENGGIPILSQLILMYLMFSMIFSSITRYNYGIRNYIRHLRKRLNNINGKNNIGGEQTKSVRTVVIGAGYTGTMFINRAFNNPEEGYFPVALIDEDPEKQNQKINGVKVEGGMQVLSEVIKKTHAEAIVIAIVSLPKPRLKELYAECKKYNLPIRVMTALKEAGEQDLSNPAMELRDIKIEELLGREEFKVNRGLLDGAVKNKTVMVTGGAGSIGSELCRQALKFGCRHLVIFDMHENGMFELNEEFKTKFDQKKYSLVVGSVREPRRLKETFEKYKPEIVFHAAAYKHVPMMEISATEAVKNNVLGTLNVIRAAEESGTERFVFISTDKAVNPANIMGASKRIAEMLIQDIGKRGKMQMAAVRFGNVLGSNGSVIPIFLRQIKEGGPITLTDRNIKRYFMTIPEAVRLVLQTGSLAREGDVFVLDMGEPVFIYDLACDLIRINGLTPEKDIEIKITGLRQGEKMFEELRYDTESVDKTAHDGIFVTRLEEIDSVKFSAQIKKLEEVALSEDEAKTADVIFEMVPSVYRSMMKDAQEATKEFLEQGARRTEGQ